MILFTLRSLSSLRSLKGDANISILFEPKGLRGLERPKGEDMPDEQQGAFKVTDRRLFNPDGTPREQPRPEDSPPTPEAPVGQVVEAEADEFSDATPEMTEFMNVVMEFAATAFIHLGLAAHPATGRPQVNLPAAQQAIEMLRVLQEKTTGNLTREEDQFFAGLLADLRLQFVSLKR